MRKNSLHFITLFIFILCSGSAHGVRISNKMLLGDGTEVDFSRALLKNETAIISLDSPYDKAEWIVMMDGKIDHGQSFCEIQVYKSTNYENSIELNVDSICKYSSGFSPTCFPADSSNYYTGRIIAIGATGRPYITLFKINVLPSTPQIIDAYFSDITWDYELDIFTSPTKFNVTFTCDRYDSDYITLQYGKDQYWNRAEAQSFEEDILLGPLNSIKVNKIAESDSAWHFFKKSPAMDWGMVFQFRVSNEFGVTYSDYFFSTDYITEQWILDRIDNYCTGAIETIKPDDYIINICGDQIHLEGSLNDISKVYITNLNGQIRPYAANNSIIDISTLIPGCYILTIETTSNGRKSLKFIKNKI